MDIYSISSNYIAYLKTLDKHVLDNEKDNGHIRPYVGIIFSVNKFNYFVPLSSPKYDKSDYIFKNGKKTIRRSVVPIHRILIKSTNEKTGQVKDNFLGKLKFSSMIPVPDSELVKLDLDNWPDPKQKLIFQNQIRYFRKNASKLLNQHAKVIYQQKTTGTSGINYLDYTVNFTLLESEMDNYIPTNNYIPQLLPTT